MKEYLIRFYEYLAARAYSSGKMAKAERHFQKVRDLAPERRAVHFNLGLIALSTGNPQEAERYFRREKNLYGPTYDVTRALGDLYYLTGKLDGAVAEYTLALEDVPSEKAKNLIKKRLHTLSDRKRYENARSSYELFDKANVLLNDLKIDEAFALFEKASAADPTNVLAINNLGALSMNHYHKHEKALEFFEQADALIDLPFVKHNMKLLKKMLRKK